MIFFFLILLLVLWILRLGHLLHREQLGRSFLAGKNERLESVNAWLRGRNEAPDVEVSNFIDNEAAIEFAILSGHISAFSVHNVAKEDASRRAEALKIALAYYRKHVGEHLAAINH